MRDCETVALCSWKPRLMSQLAFTSSAYRLGVQIACALTAVALAGSEYCRRVPIACEETCSHLFLICHWVHFQSTSFAGSGSWTQTTTRSGPEVVHFGPLLNRAQLGPLRPTSVTSPVLHSTARARLHARARARRKRIANVPAAFGHAAGILVGDGIAVLRGAQCGPRQNKIYTRSVNSVRRAQNQSGL